MKKQIMIIISCFFLAGCNFIPKLNFGTPNTTPQIIEKNKTKDTCDGEAVFNEDGVMVSCSDKYYSSKENYEKKERRMTIIERIKSFINNLVGWGFWIFVILLFVCPSAIGVIGGRLFEGVFGLGNKSFKAVIRAVEKAREDGKDLNQSLDAELDTNMKKYIAKVKDKENI